MKRILLSILSLVFCFAFCACTAKPRVLVTGLGESSGSITAIGNVEMDMQYVFREVGNKNRTYDITIGGVTYTGRYERTCISPYYKCDADVYFYKADDGFTLYFWINRELDEPVLYSLGYPEDYPLPPGPEPRSYDECRQLALEELGSRLNADEFVPLPTEDQSDHGVGFYSFFFVKTIGSAETNVIVAIKVHPIYGVISFSAKEAPSIDCFADHSKVIEALNDPNTQTLLNEKIGALYSECDPDKLSWTVINQTIVKLRSGKEGVQYDILVSSGNHESYISLLMLV